VEAGKADEVWDADTGQRQRTDHHHPVCVGDLGAQPAHIAHVLLVMHRVDDRTGTEEQQRLKERVREQVENRGGVRTDAAGGEHVTELRAR
jgi:hypothetical protein